MQSPHKLAKNAPKKMSFKNIFWPQISPQHGRSETTAYYLPTLLDLAILKPNNTKNRFFAVNNPNAACSTKGTNPIIRH